MAVEIHGAEYAKKGSYRKILVHAARVNFKEVKLKIIFAIFSFN